MRRVSFADMACPIARTLEVVGEWWTLLIVRDAFLGQTRFEGFQASLGIARNVLTARLEMLVEKGVLGRRRYCEHPPRDEYVLTEKGRALFPVILALKAWGERWEEGAPLVTLVDRTTGQVVEPTLVDRRSGAPITPETVRAAPGPAATARRTAPRRSRPR